MYNDKETLKETMAPRLGFEKYSSGLQRGTPFSPVFSSR
jgi:hypothetical protein